MEQREACYSARYPPLGKCAKLWRHSQQRPYDFAQVCSCGRKLWRTHFWTQYNGSKAVQSGVADSFSAGNPRRKIWKTWRARPESGFIVRKRQIYPAISRGRAGSNPFNNGIPTSSGSGQA
jgi:hypothetical protein